MIERSSKLNLTESEKKYLIKFKKNAERSYIGYISVGLSLGAVIVGLVIGIKFKNPDGFLIAIICGGLGANFFGILWTYQKLLKIIIKFEQYINELEINKGKYGGDSIK